MNIIEGEKLLFSDPEMRGGQQITVRVGEKWRDLFRRYPGGFRVRVFMAGNESAGSIGLAHVTAAIYGPLGSEISHHLAPMNHQENCRDLDGLFDELAHHYPNFLGGRTNGTILIFEFAPGLLYEDITGYPLPSDDEPEVTGDVLDGSEFGLVTEKDISGFDLLPADLDAKTNPNAGEISDAG